MTTKFCPKRPPGPDGRPQGHHSVLDRQGYGRCGWCGAEHQFQNELTTKDLRKLFSLPQRAEHGLRWG